MSKNKTGTMPQNLSIHVTTLMSYADISGFDGTHSKYGESYSIYTMKASCVALGAYILH
jgi:hypothetical protein